LEFLLLERKDSREGESRPQAAGDVWTWTSIDAETKLIISYFVGDRSGDPHLRSWTTCAAASMVAFS